MFWRELANGGDANAQVILGEMYNEGNGVTEDPLEAVRWFRLAAEQGHTAAQINLGHSYAEGRGVPQDYIQAHMWFNLAAAQGLELAGEARDALSDRMTPDQIAEAQRRARSMSEQLQKQSKDSGAFPE